MLARAESVSALEKKFPNQWLLIDVTRENKYHEPLSGRLLMKAKSKQAVLKRMPSFTGSIYLTYAGRPVANNFVLHTVEV